MDGKYQEWQIGVQGQINLGFRREMAAVRNAQLELTREQVKLQEGELELSHQLAYAVRDLETNYVLTQTDFQSPQRRRGPAQADDAMYRAACETEEGITILNDLLRAQQELARRPKATTIRALVNYNKSIAQVHFRKGSLLEYNGVYLAEGPWPGKAYFDARRRSRARAASTYLDYGFTQPKVISRGPIEQHADGKRARAELFKAGERQSGEANKQGSARRRRRRSPSRFRLRPSRCQPSRPLRARSPNRSPSRWSCRSRGQAAGGDEGRQYNCRPNEDQRANGEVTHGQDRRDGADG